MQRHGELVSSMVPIFSKIKFGLLSCTLHCSGEKKNKGLPDRVTESEATTAEVVFKRLSKEILNAMFTDMKRMGSKGAPSQPESFRNKEKSCLMMAKVAHKKLTFSQYSLCCTNDLPNFRKKSHISLQITPFILHHFKSITSDRSGSDVKFHTLLLPFHLSMLNLSYHFMLLVQHKIKRKKWFIWSMK